MNLSNLLGSIRKKTFAAAAVREARRRPRLTVTTLEDRAVPSTLPAPVIDRTSIRTLNTAPDSGLGYSPTLVADPTNPNRLVSVFIRTEANSEATNRIVFKFSNNGGQSWFTTFPAQLGFSTTTNLSTPTGIDPKASDPQANPPVFIPYTRVGTPQVAFDRFSNLYVVYGEYNDDNTSGRIVLRRFQFTGTTFNETAFPPDNTDTLSSLAGEKTIYRWVDADEAFNPTVAIDTNLGEFNDPDNLGVPGRQSDDLARAQTSVDTTRVFVAWNTRNIQPQFGAINPNVIRMAVSDDGGLNFSPNNVLNDEGNNPNFPGLAQPKIVFTQGRAGDPNSGGAMVVMWSVLDANFPTLDAESRLFDTPNATSPGNLPLTAELTGANAVFIADAVDPGNSAPHVPAQTLYQLNVPPSLAGITDISNISIALNLQHDDLSHVRIELLPPSVATPAAAGTPAGYLLVRNGVDAAGNDIGGGMEGTELGRYKEFFNLNTIFQDSASRSIQDPTAASPYSGEYRPENNTRMNSFFGNAAVLAGGNGWRLRITDFRDSSDGDTDPPPFIIKSTLRVAQNITDDSDPVSALTPIGFDLPTGARTNLNNFEGRNFATLPSGNPTNGVGAGLEITHDNSLGAYSPWQNRIYIAFNNGANVQLRYSDDAGQTWSATTTVGNGFNPHVTVDPTTGTFLVAYYSTRFDAAGVRAAVMLATSIDGQPFTHPGGIQLSASNPVNPTETYFDQITNKVKDFEPITSNGRTIGAAGYGENLGLYAFNGRVNLLHAGNWNENGVAGTALENNFVRIRTQNMTIAAGPRIIDGEQGPILANATVTETVQNGTAFQPGNTIAFNNSFAADGHRKFTGFIVTFDRVIHPSTFGPDDVIVKYRDPDDDPTTGGVDVLTSAIQVQRLDFYKDPLDGSDYGSRRFLIRVDTTNIEAAPYFGVGTYSYAIKSDVQDRVRGLNFQITNQPTPPPFSATFAGTAASIPDAIPPLTTPKDFPVNVPAFPAGQVIGNVKVEVRITHPDLSQLRLELVNPAGFAIPLVLEGDVPFDPALLQANYGAAPAQFTAFDDGSGETIATTADVAPYIGTYRPVGPLAQFVGGNPQGLWALRVTDTVQNQLGQVNQVRLIITPSTTATVPTTGNKTDQDQDGRENEVKPFPGVQDDWFSVPNPLSGAPFQQTYASGSLPITVTGPRLIASEPLGATGSEDNIALNQNVTALDVQFDRTMDADTFTVADVLRITGPLGDIALANGTTPLISIVPISGFGPNATVHPTGTDSKFFRISFLQQKLAGNYRIQLGADIADTNGLKLDSDGDAGVENLKGEAVGATLEIEAKTYGGQAQNVALPANTTITVPLQVNDSYSVRRVLATISIVHPHTRELEGRLVSPDGTVSVLLFTNSPASGSDDAQTIPPGGGDPDIFTNITFSDALPGTPIQSGGATNGTYNPVQALAQLIGKGSNGEWKLVIRNKGANPGTIKKFELKFDKQAITNGLGETVSDQVSAGFHIFQSNGNDATARSNWTPIGPIGTSSQGTVGRVSSITVDPSDPSGNTVYAAGASGGVWRTTNFLTRNPLGPNWVPLTDFGPNGSINVGSIAIYPDANGDPLKTTILVGTGSDSLNQPTYDNPGAQQYNFDGVGFLLSADAGKTWRVLDSLQNTTTFSGNTWRAIDDPARDHRFVGAVVNKVVFEPSRNSTNQFPIAYAAVGRGTAAAGVEGIYRTLDGGRTWVQITLPDAGDVMDFVLGAGSAPVTAEQTLERSVIGYLTIKGEGVYRSVNLNSTFPSFTKMLGGGGRPTVNSGAVDTTDPVRTPNVADGKITLASPAYVPGDPLANTYYQSWLYAAVSTANGDFDGLFVTKDAGTNWTKVRLMRDAAEPFFTHNSSSGGGGGNHSLALAVDPLNPNIVYLGSDQIVRVDTTFINDPYNLSLYQHSNPDGGLTRDLTTGGAEVEDRLWDDGIPDNSASPPDDANSGLLSDDPVRGNRNPFFPPFDSMTPLTYFRELEPEFRRPNRFQWNHLNLARDPYQPFFRDTTLTTVNVLRFVNQGEDVTSFVVAGGDHDFISISNITTGLDPLTGKARILFGHDNGIATFVQNDAGGQNVVGGFTQPYIPVAGLGAQTALPGPTQAAASANLQVNGSRNGDIQVGRLYDGDVQPSLLAANIANALAYGAGRRLNDLSSSTENILSTGNQNWYNPLGSPFPRIATANGVLTDELGDGMVFILRRINDMTNTSTRGYPDLDILQFPNPGEFRSDFFQVQRNGGVPISRTGGANSLFRNPADANGSNSQWDNTVRAFAISQYNRQSILNSQGQVNKELRADTYGIVLGSAEGNIYRSQNTGIDWFIVGESTIFNDSPTTALEFGAPVPNANNPRNDNDHIYVGTEEGRIWVTEFGGVAAANWKEISTGLDGSRIIKIVANPLHGTREAYAVTENGVFHMADWSATGAAWVELTNNLPAINHTAFYDANNWTNKLLIEPADPANPNTEATLTTIAVDWRPTYAATVGKPILYVGGDGGVFRSTNNGASTVWTRFPASSTDAAGGTASSPGGGMPVVKVTELDLSIGNVDPQTGKVSSTGVANVLVATTLGRGTWAVSLGDQGVTSGSGPKVISSTPTFQNAGPGNPFPALDRLTIKFDKFIEPSSFTVADVKVTTPSGNVLPTSAYTITNQAPATDNSQWLIDFVDDPATTGINESFLSLDGTYTIQVGPDITDGPASPSFAGNKMNQDGDGINGENPADAFKFTFTVGVNDLTDYIRDVYLKVLNREPTAAELATTNTKSMDTARATALNTVAKELLMTFNANEARKGLVDRLFRTTGGANLEIGNLLPAGYVLQPADRDALVAKLVNGTTTPERLIVEIMTGMTSTTVATTITGLGQTYYNNAVGALTGEPAARAYLTQVYKDLFRFGPATSRLDFTWLSASVQAQQVTQVDTPAERFTFVNNLVRTMKAVQFYEGGVVNAANLKTIYVRDWIIRLAYAKYLNRTINPTTWDQPITSAEITAGRSLLAAAQAANQLQTSEKLIQKVMGSKEFFSLQTQVGGPDAGLHTNRSWVDGMFRFFVRRGTAQNVGTGPTGAETDTYSQKVLDLFETQRTTFINGILNGTEYKNLQADKYYQIVFGRVATTAEKNSWRTSLANGSTYAGLVAGLFGSTAFFNGAPGVVGGGSTASQNTWARAVLTRAYGLPTPPLANDPEVLALESRANAVGRTKATLELVMNGDRFRNRVIDESFQTTLGRLATTAEKDAYRAFLASTAGANRWERIIRDILAQGNVVVAGQIVSLPREFWEIAG